MHRRQRGHRHRPVLPRPVQGKLALEMQRLIEQFDKHHRDIHVTAVYTGSYDDTNLKTRAAIQASIRRAR
jgi:sn-glycerol 3-phosphate transport system substrate-binding protein